MSSVWNYSHITAPLSLFSCFICGFAVFTSYIYPQTRKFPNVVLVWTCISDFVLALYTCLKWFPGPVLDYYNNNLDNRAFCSFSIYIFWAMLEGATILGLLLSFTLYSTIVRRMDVDYMTEKYYYKYIAVFWISTIFIPLLCLAEPSAYHDTHFTTCKLQTEFTILFKFFNWAIPFALQISLLVPVFYVVYTVTRAVQPNVVNNQSHINSALVWLLLRSVGAQCNQVVAWVPVVYLDFLTLGGIPIPASQTWFVTFAPVLLSLNGFIVMAGNTPFRMALNELCSRFRIYFGFQPTRDVPLSLMSEFGSGQPTTTTRNDATP